MVYDYLASGGRGGPTRQERHRMATRLVEPNGKGAPTDERRIIEVAAMHGIHAACDRCSRDARYAVHYGPAAGDEEEEARDEWLCRSHLRRLLEAWLGQLAE